MNRRRVLIICRPRKLPQRIVTSDTAAYEPHLKAIHIRADVTGSRYVKLLVHELGHWVIDWLTTPLLILSVGAHLRHRCQETYDQLVRRLT